MNVQRLKLPAKRLLSEWLICLKSDVKNSRALLLSPIWQIVAGILRILRNTFTPACNVVRASCSKNEAHFLSAKNIAMVLNGFSGQRKKLRQIVLFPVKQIDPTDTTANPFYICTEWQ